MNKILVVESHKRSREQLQNLLIKEGYKVEAVDAGMPALELIKRYNVIDLIIIAWDLSGNISGSELLMRLKQNKLSIPSIIIMSPLILDTCNRAILLGAVDIIQKPVDSKRLSEAVRRVLFSSVKNTLVTELHKQVIGNSLEIIKCLIKLAQAIQKQDTNVLIIGESGVGKDLFAELIHNKSINFNSNYLAVNLAGLSPSLIESELFGHEKGSFTGADRRHLGAFERAGNGTLLLDEIGYLHLNLQPKLLRVIEERKFFRVGGSEDVKFRARLICATSLNLTEEIKKGTFREDLYYRISEFEIRIPPLRDRKEDLKNLTNYFLNNTGFKLARETLLLLEEYSFPGNIRELQKILKHAQTVCSSNIILPVHLPSELMTERQKQKDIMVFQWPESLFQKTRDEALDLIEKEFDRVFLIRKLQESGYNREKAAEKMGITPKTLREKLRECGLGSMIRQKKD